MFNHLQIIIDEDFLSDTIEKFNFKNLSSGRNQGEENIYSHFRKDTLGDWKNYFTSDHVNLFKGNWWNVLIKLNYEKDHNW